MSKFEKLEWYKQQKKERRKQIQRESYNRRKDRKTKTKNVTKKQNKVQSKQALWKRKQRERKEERVNKIKEHTLQRVRKYRQKQKSLQNQDETAEGLKSDFKNRMEKSRAISKLRQSLPETPEKRVSVLEAYLDHKSPTAKKVKSNNVSPIDIQNIEVAVPVVEALQTVIKETKFRRSEDARATMNVLVAAVSGESVVKNKVKNKVARSLGLPARRVSKGVRIRENVLKSDKSCWTHTERKTRSDALSESDKKTAYDFWLCQGNSHPTGNKADVKRVRIGPTLYSSHMIHILERSQTDVYFEFSKSHPGIKMCQRTFERCKPYFVQPVRPKDRQTCVCRYHIEAKSLFYSCMNFRKQNTEENPSISESYPVFDHLHDVVNYTLCSEEPTHVNCLNRNCTNCGVKNLKFLPAEEDTLESAPKVTWSKYEYINLNMKKGKTMRKLSLVKKETSPGEMFSYFLEILSSFSSHQFRAKWQASQLKYLQENLPINHCLCIHDFSENFSCFDKQEIQSSYFQKNEVSLHVSVLYRHAVLEYDGIDSTLENPHIITEQFFVISPDLIHDHYFVQHVQLLISQYLSEIKCKIDEIHEFTGGCQCQYKSRHCIGGLSTIRNTLGYNKIRRNFFESAHGKGPQDAAGGCIKHQADLAIRRGTTTIQSAEDLYRYAKDALHSPKFSMCKRRLFR